MPFRRPDGDLVPDLHPVRRMMPHLMPTRTESVVFHEQLVDATAMTEFCARWNGGVSHKITPFHLVLAAIARALEARPLLNRFVSGGRLYQRRGCHLSFAAKRAFADDAPLVTVKLEVPRGEPFADTVRRVHEAVGVGRGDAERGIDKEVRLLTALPHVLTGWLVRLFRALDRWNLAPGAMIATDPMYASVFVANLGSVGLDRTWHHLYEYGTVSLFCVIGAIAPRVVPGPEGAPVVRPTLSLRWTLDERIADGFYCARALELVSESLANPDRLLAPWPG